MTWATVETRLGRFTVVVDAGAVVRIGLPGTTIVPAGDADSDPRDQAVLQQAARQIQAFADGRLPQLSFPVRPEGTPFQLAVWQALSGIPLGETRSYADIAAAVGRPGAARAVGQANRANPLPLVVPCHRVVSTDGLGGYMGQHEGSGIELKRRLLELEGVLH